MCTTNIHQHHPTFHIQSIQDSQGALSNVCICSPAENHWVMKNEKHVNSCYADNARGSAATKSEELRKSYGCSSRDNTIHPCTSFSSAAISLRGVIRLGRGTRNDERQPVLNDTWRSRRATLPRSRSRLHTVAGDSVE